MTALGIAAPAARTPRAAGWRARLGRVLAFATAGVILCSAVAGGLARVGIVLPAHPAGWLGAATAWHAALMIGGFLGTAIGLERAVALGSRWAFSAPALSAAAALCLLAGQERAGGGLLVASGFALVALHAAILRRQASAATLMLGLGAVAALGGHLLFAFGTAPAAPVPAWFAFLVLAIVGERLQLSRLTRRGPAAEPALWGCVLVLAIGAVRFVTSPAEGGLAFGLGLLLLAGWLFTWDIARRTILLHGAARYMAACLLVGQAWLAVAGLAWIGMAFGAAWRDAGLHALGLGFVFGMLMAHAPVIVPAVARIPLRFTRAFYLPVGLLHGSLALRLSAGHADFGLRALGAAGNAAAIALFALTLAGAALAARRPRRRPARPPAGPHP